MAIERMICKVLPFLGVWVGVCAVNGTWKKDLHKQLKSTLVMARTWFHDSEPFHCMFFDDRILSLFRSPQIHSSLPTSLHTLSSPSLSPYSACLTTKPKCNNHARTLATNHKE
jgi:hypothetical protein